jgi:peptidyl-prolyl cis-trans isomerase SurA
MKSSFVTLCLILLSASPVLAGDKVVARVGNEPITRMEVETALARNPGVTRSQVLESLIERSLVLSWANSHFMTVSEEEVDNVERSFQESNNLTADQLEQALRARGETMETFREDLREQVLVNRALGTALRNKVTVSEEDIVKLYQETYPSRETYELRHILFKVDKGASEEDALSVKRQADKVLGEIQAGAPFDAMVRQHSQDTSSVEKGGQLGTFRSGELIPELENAVLALAAGETGGPVRTPAGYHIVHLQSRGTEEPPPLITVRDQLQSRLMAEKEIGAREAWLQEIREETYVEIFSDEL